MRAGLPAFLLAFAGALFALGLFQFWRQPSHDAAGIASLQAAVNVFLAWAIQHVLVRNKEAEGAKKSVLVDEIKAIVALVDKTHDSFRSAVDNPQMTIADRSKFAQERASEVKAVTARLTSLAFVLSSPKFTEAHQRVVVAQQQVLRFRLAHCSDDRLSRENLAAAEASRQIIWQGLFEVMCAVHDA